VVEGKTAGVKAAYGMMNSILAKIGSVKTEAMKNLGGDCARKMENSRGLRTHHKVKVEKAEEVEERSEVQRESHSTKSRTLSSLSSKLTSS